MTEWNNYSLTGTTTTVTASNASPVYGDSVTLTATVKASSGSTTPEGTVVFYYTYVDPVVSTLEHQVELGTVTLANGVASLSTSSLPTGVNSVWAAYQGSSSFSESLSSVLSVTALTPTTTQISGGYSTAVPYGTTQQFSAGVSPNLTTSSTPTGTITFYCDGTALGTVTSPSNYISTTALPVGTNTITAVYSGDSLFEGSTSSSMTRPVTSTTASAVSTTTTLTASPTSLTYGGTETLTAKVAASSGSTTPTGTVTFYNGTTSLGTGTLPSGTATLTTTALPVGTRSLKVVYAGATGFNASTSSAVSVAVTAAPDFALAASSSTLTVKAGATGTTTLVITDENGFSGDSALSFSCSGLPSGASCTFGTPVTTSTGSTVAVSIATSTTTAQADEKHLSAASALYTALIPAILLISIKRRKAFLALL
ncbi:Ig-like domain-containing protein [Telmatobacter bradus]|uniref:Ig-like domain-containing protein n=1 Tax=Telmatobacter bradus TaxID=474953 RepID=UPI003B4327E8